MGRANETAATRALRAVGVWGLVLLLVAVPLAVGGMRWDVQVAASGLALVLLMVTAYGRLGTGMRMPWPLWVPALLVGVGLLQLLPLPTELLAALSPAAAEVRRTSLADLGLYAGLRHPLSLDPAATWVAVFHQAAFVAVALLAANANRQQRRVILRAIAASAALVALIGLAHWAIGTGRIFGLYAPRHHTRLDGFFATFVNENTQASFLALGALVSLGLVAASDKSREQRLALVAGALAGAGAVLSGSRGGHLALLGGLLVFAALAHARQDEVDATRRRARTVASVGILLGILAVGVALSTQSDLAGLFAADPATDAKLANWDAATAYARDFWATGSGRGTFGYVFPRYREVLAGTTVTHPETIGLQMLTEWGLVLGLAAIIAGVLGWWRVFTGVGRESHPAHWGGVAALAAVGLHQLSDFGFESVSLSLPVAAVFGVALGSVTRARRQRSPARPAISGAVLGVALVLAILVAHKGPGAVGAHPDRAHAALRDASDEAVAPLARALVAEHPADYLLPLTAAARLGARRDRPVQESLRWLNRALYLYPKGDRAHLLAARLLLLARRPAQAALEYRLAMESAPWRVRTLSAEAARRLKDPRRIAAALPPGDTATAAAGNALLEARRGGDARAAMQIVLETRPEEAGAHLVLARACWVMEDLACVERESDWLAHHGRLATSSLFRARLRFRAGDPTGARRALETGAKDGADDANYQRVAARIYADLKDIDAARKALDRLWVLTGAQAGTGASTLTLRGHIEAEHGDPRAAARSYEQAYDRKPSPTYATRAIRAASEAGMTEVARRILDDASRRWPTAESLRHLKVISKD